MGMPPPAGGAARARFSRVPPHPSGLGARMHMLPQWPGPPRALLCSVCQHTRTKSSHPHTAAREARGVRCTYCEASPSAPRGGEQASQPVSRVQRGPLCAVAALAERRRRRRRRAENRKAPWSWSSHSKSVWIASSCIVRAAPARPRTAGASPRRTPALRCGCRAPLDGVDRPLIQGQA